MNPCPQLPRELVSCLRNRQLLPSRQIITVSVVTQTLRLFEMAWEQLRHSRFPQYRLSKELLISTSAYGVGQVLHSNQTPLGLHRVAKKIGAGQPIGAVFRGRRVLGFTWQGLPEAAIVHRILWLEGLERGYNQGGNLDSFNRFIYIHGVSDETTLGRPASHGCIHVAARDLIPLFDLLPIATLVWIALR